MFLKIVSILLPWSLKRRALQAWFGYQLHPGARIGLAWVFPRMLKMDEGAKIDHFTVAIHLDLVTMGRKSSIGRGNWITGFPTGTGSKHFGHQADRRPEFVIGESAAITKNHHFDCTHRIEVGRFSTIAGYQSQFLTHSIDVIANRQDSYPIVVGEYTFVGTNVVVLGGAVLPSHSVLGAKSLLNKPFAESWKVYGGIPAKVTGEIPADAAYFTRETGFVY